MRSDSCWLQLGCRDYHIVVTSLTFQWTSCPFSACDACSWEVEPGDDPSWEGHKLRAGLEKGVEELFLTHLLYFQHSAEERIPRLR